MFAEQKEFYDRVFEGLESSRAEITAKVFENCKFIKCNFSEATFYQCKFCDCKFEHCNLSVIKVKASSFVNVEFIKSKVVGVNWTEAVWPRIAWSGLIHFVKSNVSQSSFFGLRLPESSFIECKIHDADFREADLEKANFSFSDLTASLFVNTKLIDADFSYAFNYNLNASENKIYRAKFMLPEAQALLYGLDIKIVEST